MGLGQSLRISASGLAAQATGIEVLSNNVANVNSVAFKSSRADFTNLFYRLISGAAQADGDLTGRNPVQIGEGAGIGGTTVHLNQGPIQQTGISDNLYIFGAGYFIARRGEEQIFTRNGAFQFDANGNLTTSQGYPVQGYGVDEDFNIVETEVSDLSIPLGLQGFGLPTTTATWGGTLDPTGEVATQATIRETGVTNATSLADAIENVTVSGGLPIINDGSGSFQEAVQITYGPEHASGARDPQTITLSPGDSLQRFTDFVVNALGINTSVTQPAGNEPGATFTSDGRIRVTGNLGTFNDFTVRPTDFQVTRVSDGGVGSTNFFLRVEQQVANGESASTQTVVFDSNGDPVDLQATVYLSSVTSSGSNWKVLYTSSDQNDGLTDRRFVAESDLSFDTSGRFLSETTESISIDLTNRSVETPLVFANDFSRVFALSNPPSVLGLQSQDGLAKGTLTDFVVTSDGTIQGIIDNGGSRTLGRVLLARFDNPSGLIAEAESFYREGPSSGVPVIVEPENGAGTVGNGAIEGSNVDFAVSLVELVRIAAAFNANSRTFATSQELLSQFNQLIRQL